MPTSFPPCQARKRASYRERVIVEALAAALICLDPGARHAAGDRPADGADRAGLERPQDQGRRRRKRRGRGRARDREEDPNPAPTPRLPRRDDADGPHVQVRQRRQHRPGAVLQPAPRGAHAPHPRRRLDRLVPARALDPLPRPPSGLDGRHLLREPARRPARPALDRGRDRRARPRPLPAQRPDRLQLGERAGDPRRDRAS